MIPRAQVLLPCDPKDPEPVVTEELELTRLRADPTVARDYCKIASRHRRHPNRVKRAERSVRFDQVMAYVNDVAPSDGEGLAQTQRALVDVKAELGRISGHRRSPGEREAVTAVELVADRRLHVVQRELIQSRNPLHRLARSHLLCDHFGGDAANHRLAELA